MCNLTIAIPNKGRLSEDIFDLLQRAGLSIKKQNTRSLYAKTHDGLYKIIFVRTQDIPNFVNDGVTDLGITGYDVVKECEAEVENIMPLNFGYCKMIVAAKETSSVQSIDDVKDGCKIATSFPNITKNYFDSKNKNVHIIEVSGATEVTPELGLADLIVDITSTGSTLKVNKLKILDQILESTATIIGRPGICNELKDEINKFIRAIKSAIAAEEKKYLMANLPKTELDNVKNFLPGITSPTVTTLLDNPDTVAIHVVIDKKKIYESVDKLKQLGATGILIMSVDQMIP